MFTGIIQDIGAITAIDKRGDWILTIKTKLPLAATPIGASISCNGICLTLIEKQNDEFKVQLSAETLSKTTAKHWNVGQQLNLETALKAGDELGGHYLSGHIDGIAKVTASKPEADSVRYTFEVPAQFVQYLAPKGSVSIDGVSLTVNEVKDNSFGVNIIPHTQKMTGFGMLKTGDEVNFEVDMIARYVERMLSRKAAS